MARLIDADKLIAKIEDIYDGYMLSQDGGTVPNDFVEFLEEAPTVEAIPKADYENRLKADLKAILVELQLEIEEIDSRPGYDGNGMPTFANDYVRIIKVNEIIQQKINSLKENKDE